MSAKYERYQDYVIRDGRFIGDFEAMYQDHDDPWEQGARHEKDLSKAVALHLCQAYGFRKICELGCGHGHFTNMLHTAGFEALGVDIAPTAVKKASLLYPHCRFIVGDVLNFSILKRFQPDCIIMSELTWYILDRLDEFLERYKKWEGFPERRPYLLHTLTTYPKGVQKYGV